jgi:hypothetical protein
MNEFKGTKGKWEVTQMQNVCNENGRIIVSTQINFSVQETQANALLISKAPEMLEMLEKCEYFIRASNQYSELGKKVEQLIKEATQI